MFKNPEPTESKEPIIPDYHLATEHRTYGHHLHHHHHNQGGRTAVDGGSAGRCHPVVVRRPPEQDTPRQRAAPAAAPSAAAATPAANSVTAAAASANVRRRWSQCWVVLTVVWFVRVSCAGNHNSDNRPSYLWSIDLFIRSCMHALVPGLCPFVRITISEEIHVYVQLIICKSIVGTASLLPSCSDWGEF